MERRLRKKSHVVAAAATIIGLGERQKTMVEQKRKVCIVYYSDYSLFSTRRIYWREQRKKQLDWLATNTDDITIQSGQL